MAVGSVLSCSRKIVIFLVIYLLITELKSHSQADNHPGHLLVGSNLDVKPNYSRNSGTIQYMRTKYFGVQLINREKYRPGNPYSYHLHNIVRLRCQLCYVDLHTERIPVTFLSIFPLHPASPFLPLIVSSIKVCYTSFRHAKYMFTFALNSEVQNIRIANNLKDIAF